MFNTRKIASVSGKVGPAHRTSTWSPVISPERTSDRPRGLHSRVAGGASTAQEESAPNG